MTPASSDRGRLPTFIVIGAMRSGTTALSHWLGEHPQVFMAPGKEVHFFDRRFDQGLDWYRSMFASAGSAPQVGEATPNYLHDPPSMRRIFHTLPDIKLVAILRNPVDRAYSHYWLNRTRRKETLSFPTALEAEPTRLEVDPYSRATYSYMSRGQYATQLDAVLELFPRSSLYVAIAEELLANPAAHLAELYEFLLVDPGFVPTRLNQRINRFVEFRSLSVRRLSKHLPQPLSRIVGRLNVRPASRYPPLDPALRVQLTDVFADSNRRLATLLGRTNPIWS